MKQVEQQHLVFAGPNMGKEKTKFSKFSEIE